MRNKKDTNEVVIGSNADLFKKTVLVRNFNYMAYEDIVGEMRVEGKVRYSQKKSPCIIRKKANLLNVYLMNLREQLLLVRRLFSTTANMLLEAV